METSGFTDRQFFLLLAVEFLSSGRHDDLAVIFIRLGGSNVDIYSMNDQERHDYNRWKRKGK